MRTTKVATSLLRIGAILLAMSPATQAGTVSYLGHGRGTGDYFAPHDPAPHPISGPATVAVAYQYDPTIVGVPTALGTEYDGLFLEITITIPQGGRDWVWEMDPNYGGWIWTGSCRRIGCRHRWRDWPVPQAHSIARTCMDRGWRE
jgi:hypothetical protein